MCSIIVLQTSNFADGNFHIRSINGKMALFSLFPLFFLSSITCCFQVKLVLQPCWGVTGENQTDYQLKFSLVDWETKEAIRW